MNAAEMLSSMAFAVWLSQRILIESWANNWRMSFNPDPNKQAVEVTFSKKRIPINHPPIFFNDVPVKNVQEQ